MVEKIKIMLGEAAENFSEAQIELALEMAIAEIEDYCKRDCDNNLLLVACKMAVVKLNRTNTEGLASQNFSGVSESFIDGYPAEIIATLNAKRKIKTL